MRGLLSTIAGTPGRLSVSAMALTAISLVLLGHAQDLIVTLIGGTVIAGGFIGFFVVLGAVAAAFGVFEAGQKEKENADA